MRSETKLSVIIPTFRRTQLLRDLLGSLERQICDVPFEVIVVANLPERDLKKTVQSFGRNFRFYETGRINANIAKNKGIERAAGSVLLFLEDDGYLQSRDVLQRHWDLHEKHADAVAIGGRYTLKPDARKIERAYHWLTDLRLTRARRDDHAATDLPGGNCSFKKKLLGKILHFDEYLPAQGAETNLFNDLIRAGYKILAFDDLKVEHRLHTSRWDFMRKAFHEGYTQARIEAMERRAKTLHWNSLLSFKQNMHLSGHKSYEQDLEPLVSLYEKVSAFGRWFGRRAQTKTLPALPWRDYFVRSVLKGLRRRAGAFQKRSYLLLDRSLSLEGPFLNRDPH